MRFSIPLVCLTVLAGCATGTQMQAECEGRFNHFPDIFQCTKDSIAQRNPRIMQDARAKMYLLRGEQLVQSVVEGKMSSLDARVEWQKLYVQLRGDAESEAARNAAIMGLAVRCHGSP